ncbi:MAG: POT family MFS transporter [Planctomycetota bacterium]|nr:POT family MFS transporter [Planctomycetota bacterium]
MDKSKYLTAPLQSEKMPAGIPYILVNEAAERFSFYGMSAILVMFMTHHLMDRGGALNVMGGAEANRWFFGFNAAVYFMTLAALISDIWLGKYKTIISFSIVYCLGFLVLVLDQTRLGLKIGLALIAVGSGIIKPCVSANVGDQFGRTNQHLIPKIYSWFYFAINLGACISMLLCPWLRNNYGPRVAFGVPCVFMVLATIAFRLGKWKFVHIPAEGFDSVRKTLDSEGLKSLVRLCLIYVFVAMFFALFYQSQSAWVLQAEKMNLKLLWITWLPDQIQFVNSLLVMIMIPLFAYAVYPAINKVFRLTALSKISIGLFVTVLSFVVAALIETRITSGDCPSIGWQFFAYVILTAAEIMVSITCLEFSYTQAPKKMKSFIMALFLLSISAGNAIAFVVNWFIQNADGSSKLPGASYYWFFTVAMLVTAILFIPVARSYRVQNYIQDEAPAET